MGRAIQTRAACPTSNMHGVGESDGCILPTKGPNSAGQLAGEGLEGRRRGGPALCRGDLATTSTTDGC